LLAGIVPVQLAFGPGIINADTNATLWEAHTGSFRDWYTPFGSAFFWLTNQIGIGLEPVFFLQTAIAALGVYLLLRPVCRRVYAALISSVICLSPPVLSQLAYLSRDSMCLAFTLLAFGLLAWSYRTEESSLAGVWAAVAAGFVAYLWRNNAIIIVGTLLAVALAATLRPGSAIGRRIPRFSARASLRWASAIVAAAFISLGVVIGSQGVYRVAGVEATYPQRTLWVYDLAAISVRTGVNAFPKTVPRVDQNRQGVIPPDISLAALRSSFKYQNVLSLYPDGDWTRGLNDPALDRSDETQLYDAWRHAVARWPGEYLAERATVLVSDFGFIPSSVDAMPTLNQASNYGHPLWSSNGYKAARAYLRDFGMASLSPMDTLWPYLLIGTVALLSLRRRHIASNMPMVAFWVAVWLSFLALGAVTMASGYRYTVLAIPPALVLVVWAVQVRMPRHTDRGHPQPVTESSTSDWQVPESESVRLSSTVGVE
jgi:hypothetical protein